MLRPFFEILLQDGLTRQGKLSFSNTSISGFLLLQADSLTIDATGYQILSASLKAANGGQAQVNMFFPVGNSVTPPLILLNPEPPASSQSSRENTLYKEDQMVVCAHPYMFGPPVLGRVAAAWEEVRDQVIGARDHLSPDIKAGIFIPAWEDPAFLEKYLADWQNWKRLAFVLVRFDEDAFRNNRHFLKTWELIRETLPPDVMRIAWGTISPFYGPLLAYLGFDAITDFASSALAGRKLHASPYGYIESKAAQITNEVQQQILAHNQNTWQTMHRDISYRIVQGTLRELVEMSTHLENPIAATLRNYDAAPQVHVSPSVRLNKSSGLQCTSVEAYFRPELELYRHHLRQRYAVPSYKKLIVLLPCSATKPYRDSPSHRKFRETIRGAARAAGSAIEELIITSPLGMVPRALESLYPACFYDVPVTGQWDDVEVQISVEILANILSRVPAEIPIAAVAEGGYLQVCEQLAPRISQTIQIFTPAPKLLSPSVLSYMSTFIESHLLHDAQTPKDPKEPRLSETEEWCHAIADFQFGAGAGAALFPSRLKVKVPRRGPSLVYESNNNVLIAMQQASGYFRPQLEGARRLVASHISEFGRVYFAGNQLTGSSLFAAGVVKVEGEIHPGDFIAILSQESRDILATAEAVVDGASMTRMRGGGVAKLLEKPRGA
ncbi:MAG: tRNA-archaeosine synthase [Promethearchaeota archaeon CR_4]|nr:MAG: tRNA-archaeosine synthase [Candidatus Lokiarchaeota archaeon CR_4]